MKMYSSKITFNNGETSHYTALTNAPTVLYN